MTDEAPIAIHSKAIEKACEDDRAWFESNPEKTYRIRDMVPFEANQALGPAPSGSSWRTVVALLGEGVRARTFVTLPIAMRNEGASQKNLADLWVHATSSASDPG